MERSAQQVLTSKLPLGFDRAKFQMPCVSYKANPGITVTMSQVWLNRLDLAAYY